MPGTARLPCAEKAAAACQAPAMAPWQGNLHSRTKAQQSQDGAGDETGQLASKPGWQRLVHAQHPITSNLLSVGGRRGAEAVARPGWSASIMADISSVQGSRARTVRRTSTTVRATTARMEAPAWTVSTPTTASARPSGQVKPPPAARVARGWAGRKDPTPKGCRGSGGESCPAS